MLSDGGGNARRLSIVQYHDAGGRRAVAALDESGAARCVEGVRTSYDLAVAATRSGDGIASHVVAAGLGDAVDLGRAEREGRLLPPIDHPDPAHVYLTGTGLTHLGSAEGRDRMHRAVQSGDAVTDSMRMFLMGVEGGKPAELGAGVQPEWFYKGDGSCLVASGQPLSSPSFALDAGEEPEIAGVYLIGLDGSPLRLGFALANEFSDHVTERGNYLWLAHSKLRPAALGPELLLGALPAEVSGTSRIVRSGEAIWEKPFLSGEAHMSHSIANLEHHHFKYPNFRRPGDVHIHFFGTATLSFADDVRTREGDLFEISAAPFRLPLRNRLGHVAVPPVHVRAL